MRAPHPALRELYRQAATPAAQLEREQREATLIARLEVDLGAAGLSGEALLAPLIDTDLFGTRLDRSLERVEQAAPAAAEAFVQPARPIMPTSLTGGGGDGAPHRAMPIDPARIGPQGHHAMAVPGLPLDAPRAAVEPRAVQAAARARPARTDRVAAGGAAGDDARRDSARRQPPAAVATAARASEWLAEIARRAGAEAALHRTIEAGSGDDPTEIAERADAGQELHRTVGNRAGDGGARSLTAMASAALRAAGTPQPRAIPAHALHERLTALLTRIEGASANSGAAPPDRHRRAERAAASGAVSEGSGEDSAQLDVRGDPRAPAAIQATRPAAPPVGRREDRSVLSAPTGGLRGLVALGRSMSDRAAAQANARARESGQPNAPDLGPSAIDADQLADLLRREAERSGIDLTGLEP